MKELFSFGLIHIYFFGLMVSIGIVISSIFALKQGKKRRISEDSILKALRKSLKRSYS